MADSPEYPGPPDRPIDDPEAGGGISELQARLNELQRSVELLGTQGVWASHGSDSIPNPHPPQPPTTTPQPPPAATRYRSDPQVAPPVESPVAPHDPAPQMPPPVPAPISASAPPAATNGHAEEEPGISGPEASVAMVDAGPFADLVELRHFEDDLSSLAAVHDVRVRRYGQGRAMIEVGMAGPYELARELPRLGLPMDVAPAGDDELIIEFAPLPEHGPETEPADVASDAEGA